MDKSGKKMIALKDDGSSSEESNENVPSNPVEVSGRNPTGMVFPLIRSHSANSISNKRRAYDRVEIAEVSDDQYSSEDGEISDEDKKSSDQEVPNEDQYSSEEEDRESSPSVDVVMEAYAAAIQEQRYLFSPPKYLQVPQDPDFTREDNPICSVCSTLSTRPSSHFPASPSSSPSPTSSPPASPSPSPSPPSPYQENDEELEYTGQDESETSSEEDPQEEDEEEPDEIEDASESD